MGENVSVWNNPTKNRYEAFMGDKLVGVIKYRFESGFTLAVISTEVRSSYQGLGIAAQLTKTLLEEARANKYAINPLCSYTRVYIERHPEFQDLLNQTEIET